MISLRTVPNGARRSNSKGGLINDEICIAREAHMLGTCERIGAAILDSIEDQRTIRAKRRDTLLRSVGNGRLWLTELLEINKRH
jgi:hypothetical protein